MTQQEIISQGTKIGEKHSGRFIEGYYYSVKGIVWFVGRNANINQGALKTFLKTAGRCITIY